MYFPTVFLDFSNACSGAAQFKNGTKQKQRMNAERERESIILCGNATASDGEKLLINNPHCAGHPPRQS